MLKPSYSCCDRILLCRDISWRPCSLNTKIVCRDRKVLCCNKVAIFFVALIVSGHKFMCRDRYFYLKFFNFVATFISFVAIEFLTIACYCCCDRPFLCLDRVLLSCTTELSGSRAPIPDPTWSTNRIRDTTLSFTNPDIIHFLNKTHFKG